MKTHAFALLLTACCSLAVLTNGQQSEPVGERLSRRQAVGPSESGASNKKSTGRGQIASVSASSTAMSSISSSSSETAELADDEHSNRRPIDVPIVERPERNKRPKQRVRPNRKPVRDDEDENRGRNRGHADELEDCDDYETGGGGYYADQLVPIGHFSRMMHDMFDRMQGMASGDYESFPGGSNVAVASSYSGTDGNSRVSSLVNRNGKTRGIVSETRNGRTQTRRIGGGRDDEEDEE